ncbi:MAG: hypothetical protein KGL39_59185, partial [Patescibacteria group bacterium]|nr:hypothetical protein [Patescibacteria group bacterium]
MIAFRLNTEALDELQARAAKLGQESQVALVGAEGAADLTRKHLFALDTRSPRSHFYSRAAKSVRTPQPEGRGASFTITQTGLAQRWFGGPIVAGKGTSSATGAPTKYLAIGTDEVEGKTPKEEAMEQDMAFVPRGNGKAMLVQGMRSTATRGKHKGEEINVVVPGGRVLFWLVPSVDQKPDPTVMPTDVDLAEAAR